MRWRRAPRPGWPGWGVVNSLEAALADCQLAVAVSAEGREFGPPPEFPGPLCAQVLDELAAGRLARVAFVFGTERTGLSVDEMRRCSAG